MLSARALEFSSEADNVILNYNTKTPGKRLLKTPGKTALRNRTALQENAMYYAGGSMTVNSKGKYMQMHTPFHPATIQAKRNAQTVLKPTVVVSRPLGDKTPFPNRQQPPLKTPAPQTAKIAKLSLLENHAALLQTPGSLLLPSARRKSLRARNSESGREKLNFKTPISNGNHWDVSDDGIEVDANEGVAEENEVQLDDSDEVEYMPPKQTEIPYEPPFPMPDHKALGKTLLNLAHSYPLNDSAERYFAQDIDTQIDAQDLLHSSNAFELENVSLPNLEDDDTFHNQPVEKSNLLRMPTNATKISTPMTRLVPITRAMAQRSRSTDTLVRSTLDPAGYSAASGPANITTKNNLTTRPATSVGVRATRTALLRKTANTNRSSAHAMTTASTSIPKPAVTKMPTSATKMSSGPSSTRPRETSTAQAKVPQRPRVGSIARVKLNPSLVTKVDQDMWLFKDGGAGLLNNDSDDFRFEV